MSHLPTPLHTVHAIPAYSTLMTVATNYHLPAFSEPSTRPDYCPKAIQAILPGKKMAVGGMVHHFVITDAPGQIEAHVTTLIEGDLMAYRDRPEWEGENVGDDNDYDEVGALLTMQRDTEMFF